MVKNMHFVALFDELDVQFNRMLLKKRRRKRKREMMQQQAERMKQALLEKYNLSSVDSEDEDEDDDMEPPENEKWIQEQTGKVMAIIRKEEDNHNGNHMVERKEDDEKRMEEQKEPTAKSKEMRTTLISNFADSRSEGKGYADKMLIRKQLNILKMSDDETPEMVAQKVEKATELVKEGKFGKADRILGDGRLVDLNANGNWTKLKSKFPERAPLEPQQPRRAPKWNLSKNDMTRIIKNLRKNASGGIGAVENRIFQKMVLEEEKYHFLGNLRLYLKTVVEKGMPEEMAAMMRRAKGVALGKRGETGFDHDVRPLVVFDSALRLEDGLIWRNVNPEDRKRALGPMQLVEAPDGVGYANLTLNVADKVLSKTGDRAMRIGDATNAFNTMDREHGLDLVVRKVPDFTNWYLALYGGKGKITVHFDDEHTIEMAQGFPQGLPSSMPIYAVCKHDVEWRTQRETKRRLAIKNVKGSEAEFGVTEKGAEGHMSLFDGARECDGVQYYGNAESVMSIEEERELEKQGAELEVDPWDDTRARDRFEGTNCRIEFETQYADDGVLMMWYQMMPTFDAVAQELYGAVGITFNMKKTEVVMNTKDTHVIAWMKEHMDPRLTMNFSGNYKYLGIPHGTDQYKEESMDKWMGAMEKKIMRMQCVRPYHERWRLLYGYQTYSMVQYRSRNMDLESDGRYMERLDAIWTHAVKDMFQGTTLTEVVKIQINLTAKAGGFGMRKPTNFYLATRITSIRRHIERLSSPFNIEGLGVVHCGGIRAGAAAVMEGIEELQRECERAITRLNAELGQEFEIVVDDQLTHRDMLEMINKKLRTEYEEKATEKQRAVRNSLAVTGAMAVWSKPVNRHYGFELTTRQLMVYLSVVTGQRITSREYQCANANCTEMSDCYGVHGSVCANGGGRVKVHDAIKKHVGILAERAGFKVEYEEKYGKSKPHERAIINGEETREIVVDEEVVAVDGRCGDVVIRNWFGDGRSDTSLYGDVVVGMISATSYVKRAAKQQQYVAKMWEERKRSKYKHPPNFVPLALEFPGSVGPMFKAVLQRLATKTAFLTNQPKSQVMSRMRTEIVVTMIMQCVRNIIASMKM